MDFLSNFLSQQTIAFYQVFMENEYYLLIIQGIIWTLGLTAIALVVGILIGITIAIVQLLVLPKKNKSLNIFGYYVLKVFKLLTSAYIYIIRGTPSVVQIVLMWFVVFASTDMPRIWVGGIAFGINSGAYMAELIRAGIQGIDKGQMEAGRSLGLNYVQTMRYIIMPQAFKQMLPAFVSEFIILIKETAIIGYIGGFDLMRASTIMSSRTYNYLQPSLIVAVCYLALTGVLTFFMKRVEKHINVSN